MNISESEIAARITAEMIHFFYENGISELELKTKLTTDRFDLCITGKTKHYHPELVDFCQELNTPRIPELEGCYNELLGMSVGISQIRMLSNMIDEAKLEQDDHHLTICIKRIIVP